MKSESEIEDILRKAPSPEPAPALRDQLQNNIDLPHRENGSIVELGQSLWRRWLPALGYTVMVLGCVVVLAVQNNQLTAALQQLDELREEVASKEQQIEQQREQTRLALAENDRIKSLQENGTEADQLAATLAELKALIKQLTAEAADLEAKLAEVPESDQVIAPYDFFNDPEGPMMKARAEEASVSCINNMKQIGLAFHIWANDNNGRFPPNFLSMSNELSSPITLCCPLDEAKRKGPPGHLTWTKWPNNGGSYEMLGANLERDSPETRITVIARCSFHGHVTNGDGSVLSGNRRGGFDQ